MIDAVGKGATDGPYSTQLGNTDRSLAPVLAALGITVPGSQKLVVRDLVRSGRLVKAKWKVPGLGDRTRTGLRTENGLPYNWEWCDVEDE